MKLVHKITVRLLATSILVNTCIWQPVVFTGSIHFMHFGLQSMQIICKYHCKLRRDFADHLNPPPSVLRWNIGGRQLCQKMTFASERESLVTQLKGNVMLVIALHNVNHLCRVPRTESWAGVILYVAMESQCLSSLSFSCTTQFSVLFEVESFSSSHMCNCKVLQCLSSIFLFAETSVCLSVHDGIKAETCGV